MIWLIGQMWFLLFLAFALGAAIGWWTWGGRDRRQFSPIANADATGSIAMDYASRAPELFSSPINGPQDDLTQIIGLDGATETRLNGLGVFYLRQIADWGSANTRWVEEELGIAGRIDREHWVEQARSALRSG